MSEDDVRFDGVDERRYGLYSGKDGGRCVAVPESVQRGGGKDADSCSMALRRHLLHKVVRTGDRAALPKIGDDFIPPYTRTKPISAKIPTIRGSSC